MDLVLLWLQCRPAATAAIQPLAWEPPHAWGVALKKQKTEKKKKKKKRIVFRMWYVVLVPSLCVGEGWVWGAGQITCLLGVLVSRPQESSSRCD